MRNLKIFSTDIENRTQVKDVSTAICSLFPGSIVTVDLEDCDKVLRVDGNIPSSEYIISLLSKLGFRCQELE
ncbi:MAG: hypothetical protein EOO46_00225 [Flavobacterium sp.]|nr:MAG: hypothetical protein EOO46_00225 [Flavobacterium sp.]